MSARGVDFESIDISFEPGRQALQALGPSTVPVVAIDERYVFGVSLDDVAAFVGIETEAEARLPPDVLVARLHLILEAAERNLLQIPAAHMEDLLPNRNRSYRQLGHHIFVIADAFLAATRGETLSYERLVVTPPPEMETGSDVAAFGATVREALSDWTMEAPADTEIPTYYGDQSLHQALERTTWHAAQHVRQLMSLVEGLGIEPEGTLTAADLAGLPLPDKVWDG